MRSLSRLLLVSLLLGAGGCTHNPPKEATPVSTLTSQQEQAQAALQRGNYDDAMKRYSELLKKFPGNRAALIGLGESYLGLAQSLPALQAFKQVLDTSPADLDAMEGTGLAYMGLEQRDKAEKILLQVTSRDLQSWRAANALGLINDLRGQYPQAMAWYERALTSINNEPVIYNNYGYSRIMAHDFAQAEVLLSYGLKLDPRNVRLRNNLIQAIAWQGQYDRALTVRGEIPLHVALNNIGYVAMLRKDLPVAAGFFQKALDQSPTWYGLAAANLDNTRHAAQLAN